MDFIGKTNVEGGDEDTALTDGHAKNKCGGATAYSIAPDASETCRPGAGGHDFRSFC
jgi:hypothetical protein